MLLISVTVVTIRHDIYPARGRKHDNIRTTVYNFSDSPRYLPRKGTETNTSCFRGIKNDDSPRYLPRKGTETIGARPLRITPLFHSPRYLPRKGTETVSIDIDYKFFAPAYIRHDIYPARGRKPSKRCSGCRVDSQPDSPRYLPRKGTETAQMPRSRHPTSRFATIFTPQGDGNLSQELRYAIAPKHSPRYLPRKGTETCDRLPIFFTLTIRHDIYPARGRKLRLRQI